MIANARMYGVSPEVTRCWRRLFESVAASAGLGSSSPSIAGLAVAGGMTLGPALGWLEHAAPAPLEELWRRPDMGAVFMCGLPFSRAAPQPLLVAAPVPSPPSFGDEARYWSEFVVRNDSAFDTVEDTFGRRIAFTVPGSQSGCIAALEYFRALAPSLDPALGDRAALFAEIIAPTITPLGALDAVIRGAAEIAPIDSYAFALLSAHRPDLITRVRVVGRTSPKPIPPVVASVGGHGDTPGRGDALGHGDTPGRGDALGHGDARRHVEALSAALLRAHTDQALQPLLEQLQLRRFVRPEPAAYDVLNAGFLAATQFWRTRPLAAVAHPAFVW